MTRLQHGATIIDRDHLTHTTDTQHPDADVRGDAALMDALRARHGICGAEVEGRPGLIVTCIRKPGHADECGAAVELPTMGLSA